MPKSNNASVHLKTAEKSLREALRCVRDNGVVYDASLLDLDRALELVAWLFVRALNREREGA